MAKPESTAEVTALELPTFKGRPGWEFTDLSRLDLSAFGTPEGGSLDDVPEGLFAGVPEGTRLDQVDAAVSEGAAVEDGPVVLPLSVARERHPELVEPRGDAVDRGGIALAGHGGRELRKIELREVGELPARLALEARQLELSQLTPPSAARSGGSSRPRTPSGAP